MSDYRDILKQFKPIGLEEIDSIKSSMKLQNRHDTKFVFCHDKLGPLLGRLLPHYRILEMDAGRVMKYENLYFDTDDLIFYQHHHNRKLNRYKLRYRTYVDSQDHFWEVKFKTNKRKTIKKRFAQDAMHTELSEEVKEATRTALAENFGFDLDHIKSRLWIVFSRITLASSDLNERITIDTGITYRNIAGHKKDLAGIVVAELKQARRSLRSPFARLAKEQHIYPGTFSKYCTGIALLENPAKIGRFKRRIMKLEKINGGGAPCYSRN